MKTVDLKETIALSCGDSSRRFWINGRKATRSEFQAVKNEAYAHGKLDCFSNSQAGGVDTFYCAATVRDSFAL